MLSTQSGFKSLLREGYRHYSGLEEAIYKNIQACKAISEITKTSYGPNGMKKMIVNHINKIFITNDAATILQEINVHHPAANLIALAAKMQKDDFGDGTNYIVTFAGELLTQAAILMRTGLHPSAVIQGYEKALEKTLQVLETCIAITVTDVSDEKMFHIINSTLSPKLPTHTKFFSKMILDACRIITNEKSPRFNDDNFRVCKILGSNVTDSQLIKGFVFPRKPVSTTKERVEQAKVVVYRCPFDPNAIETKGTVMIKNAEELINYNLTEESFAEKIVKQVVEAGVNTVIVGGRISELCLHYFDKYGIFVVKIQSKWELLRLARLLNARPINKLVAPTPEDIGFCDLIHVREIGSTKVTVFSKDQVNTGLITVVLRGATRAIMDNIERAMENGVSSYKQVLHDGRFLNGASSVESYLVNQIEKFSQTLTGLEQYGCLKYGQSFEIFSKILIENAGLNSNKTLPEFISKNLEKTSHGIDVFNGKIEQMENLQVFDNYAQKVNAIKLATKAALTVLRVDQIIMSKPAGGPKPKSSSGWDNQD